VRLCASVPDALLLVCVHFVGFVHVRAHVQEQKMAEERGLRQNADAAKKNTEEQLAKISVAYQVLIIVFHHTLPDKRDVAEI
jgi:hypothetical protein